MSDLAAIVKENNELAERINREALANPSSPYAEKFVGIANGKVVIVSDSLSEVDDRLHEVEPDNARTLSLEASVDYDKVQYIGGY